MRKLFAVLMIMAVLMSVPVSGFAGNEINHNAFGSYGVGSYVYFGSYEQDGNLDNGPEPIRWQVVEKFSHCIKLVSTEVLDARTFNNSLQNTTWETSDIRAWLNGDFYEKSFENWEKDLLEVAFVPNKAYGYGTTEKSTYDHVTLLDYNEVITYFGSRDGYARQARPTQYAKMCGAYVHNAYGTSWWWMRTQGETLKYAVYVGALGNIDKDGNPVNWQQGGVRPCIHVSTTKTIPHRDEIATPAPYYGYDGDIIDPSTGRGVVTNPETIFCPECGTKISAESKYCMYCGKQVVWAH